MTKYNSSLPQIAQIAAAALPKIYTPFPGAGIFINSLRDTQIALELVTQIERAVKESPTFGWAIYQANRQTPIMPVKTGVFTNLDLVSHIGPLITTCPITTLQSRIALGPKLIYYVYDPVILKFLRKEDQKAIQSTVAHYVVRTKEHADILQGLFNVSPTAVIDRFDLLEFEKVINGLQRQ